MAPSGRLAPARARRRVREPKRPSRLRLWLRRRRRLARPLAFGLFALALAGGLALAVAAFDPASRVARLGEQAVGAAGLGVREVIIEGRQNAPLELIRSALGVARGDAMLAFSPAAARERLETIAWIERAHVERRLPGTILVRLTERRAFAIWQHQNRFAIVDREGRIVQTERLDAFGPLPLLVGAGAEKHGATLYDLLYDQPEVLARTQAMVRVAERRWNLRLHGGTDVLLPEGHEAAAIARLAELQKSHALLDRPLAAVDMRLPDRLVLRQAPAAAPPPAPRNRNG
jgi:cell division protein FtsQ